MRKKSILATCVILMFVLSLVGACAEPAPPPAPAPAPAPAPTPAPAPAPPPAPEGPQYGGVLKILTTEGFHNLGDPRGSGPPFDGCARHIFYETLMRYGWEKHNYGEIVPWLCTGWEYNSDLTALTLTLQKGVKYHDGTDFNAQSAKECLDMYREAKLTQIMSVESIDVIDEYTLRLNTPKFDVALVGHLAQTPIGVMVSPTAMKTMSPEELLLNPVGTGAFKLVSYEPDVKAVGEKFADYWVEGRPYLDGMELEHIADPTVCRMAFERGEGDVIPRMNPKEGRELIDSGKYDVYVSKSGFEYAFGGDIANPDSPFADINVRKAIAYAVDFEALVEKLGFGIWKVNRRSWSLVHWGRAPEPVPYYYDPEKAKALLAESSYPDGFECTIYLRDPSFEDAAVVVQSYLREVGIDATVEVMTSAQGAEQAVKGWKNGMRHLLAPMSPEREPSVSYLTYYGPGNQRNASFTLPEDIVAICEKASREPDFKKRQEMAWEADRLVIDEYCLMWNFAMVPFVVPRQSYVHGDNFRHYTGHYWTPENAWKGK